jgi:hypothetical protein
VLVQQVVDSFVIQLDVLYRYRRFNIGILSFALIQMGVKCADAARDHSFFLASLKKLFLTLGLRCFSVHRESLATACLSISEDCGVESGSNLPNHII